MRIFDRVPGIVMPVKARSRVFDHKSPAHLRIKYAGGIRMSTAPARPTLDRPWSYVKVIARDYLHHGTTAFFAGLDIVNGAILAQCFKLHRHHYFLALRNLSRGACAI